MAHLALYRAWRPQNFDDVVGQKQVVYPLRQALLQGEVAHAYLFCGTRGTGKTSLAKILAKAVNCPHQENGNPCNHCSICEGINKGTLLDVLELDAASNNSVNNIRDLTDKIIYKPAEAKYKVYIIDEVHMLSQGAFNALLKTLEEPPEHAVFILATTEPQRIPATILSRCQRFDFRRLGQAEIVERLAQISAAEGIEIKDDALQLLARLADGALRDAISLLDQARSGLPAPIEREAILNMVGLLTDETLVALLGKMLDLDCVGLLEDLQFLLLNGKDPNRFLNEFSSVLRDLLICQLSDRPTDLLERPEASLRQLMSYRTRVSPGTLLKAVERLAALNQELRWASDPRIVLEIGLLDLAQKLQAGMAHPAVLPGTAPTAPVASPTPSAAPVTPPLAPTPVAAAPLAPTPVVPAPVAPAPMAPTPAQAAPMQAAPLAPAPAKVAPMEPTPVAPAPVEPAPVAPALTPATNSADTAAPTVPDPQRTVEDAAPTLSPDELWEQLGGRLQRLYRIDLNMLLAKAAHVLDSSVLKLYYQSCDDKHCKLLDNEANRNLLQTELQKLDGKAWQIEIAVDDSAYARYHHQTVVTAAPVIPTGDSQQTADAGDVARSAEPNANSGGDSTRAQWRDRLRQFAMNNQIPLQEDNNNG